MLQQGGLAADPVSVLAADSAQAAVRMEEEVRLQEPPGAAPAPCPGRAPRRKSRPLPQRPRCSRTTEGWRLLPRETDAQPNADTRLLKCPGEIHAPRGPGWLRGTRFVSATGAWIELGVYVKLSHKDGSDTR